MNTTRNIRIAAATIILVLAGVATPALAAGEAHPFKLSFGSFADPNGVAVDEATGDVYVAALGKDEQQTVTLEGEPSGGGFTLGFEGQKTATLTISGTTSPTGPEVQTALSGLSTIGTGSVSVSASGTLPGPVTYTITFEGALAMTDVAQLACDGSALTGGANPACGVATTIQGTQGTIYKFDGEGKPVDFSKLGSNELTGVGTPAKAFSFPATEQGTPGAIALDNACAQQQPALSGAACTAFDPSAGDLYVMDRGHDVVDKFSGSGEYLGQITGPFLGRGVGDKTGLIEGVGIDANGKLHVRFSSSKIESGIDVFYNNASNDFATVLEGDPHPGSATGFAVSPSGDNYALAPCGCFERFGRDFASFGRVDVGSQGEGSADVAAAVDPATGHLYVDDQSSVGEWDTGEMNASSFANGQGGSNYATPEGVLASRFGEAQLSGSSRQGGIAVNGKAAEIYVANPVDGKVYAFATAVPGVAVGEAISVTKTTARLSGAVDPRGEAVTACSFEYGAVNGLNPFAGTEYAHVVPCDKTPTEIGAGEGAVPVAAEIGELQAGLLYHFRLTVQGADGSNFATGIFATVGPGFGLKTFEVSFLNEDGSPDTQAGSHPYEMVTNIAYNTHWLRTDPRTDTPYKLEPDGNFKDVLVDLPPGLVGNPEATSKKCSLVALETTQSFQSGGEFCPEESKLASLEVEFGDKPHPAVSEEIVGGMYNMVPPRGVALQMTGDFVLPNVFIDAGVLAGGDYPVQASVLNSPTFGPAITTRLTVFGVVGSLSSEIDGRVPFLTMPTGCTGPLRSTIKVDSYQEPAHWVEAQSLTHNAAGEPVALSGCAKLKFPPEIEVSPDTTNASTSSGLTVDVHVSQKGAFDPAGLGESALRDTTVSLPEGVSINPAGGNNLEACSSDQGALTAGALGAPGDQIGYTGLKEFNSQFEPGDQTATFTPELPSPLLPGQDFCPNGSKIGTVKIGTPLLKNPLEGAVYLATQDNNPFGSLVAMYLVAEDPMSGTLVKLAGEVSIDPDTGQIVTTFKNTPDVPFENLELHFFGGERAPLSTPTHCGTYTTKAVFTPWDGNGPVTSESSFDIEHGPDGGPCPGAVRPFNPSVNAGATNIQAGAFSPLTVTANRKDGEQDLKSLEAKLPPGLSGVLSGVELCPEPQANEGLCGEGSKVGEATIGVGVGNDPFTVTGGKFYLTGPYNGHGSCTVGEAGCAPFGLTFEVPAKAGPFDLANTKNNHPRCDCVVVRGKIELDPQTSAITITSNPPGTPDSIPTSIEGIPLEIQHVNATTTRGNFQFNPTNCDKMSLTGTVQLNEGGTSTISTPFQVTNCAALKFEPKFTVSTSAKTSRTQGASLTAKLAYPNVPQGTDADIAKVKVELPKQLPSRLTTLQKACTAAQFESNPAACPAASKIGYAVVHTPLIPVPLQGPAIFVSHGGEAFPSLTLVLQGYGITIDLTGATDIKKGVTSTTFKAVPDQPFSSFELTLPEGPYSALTAPGNLCTAKNLTMPTEFLAQNGAEIKQSTKIAVTGCPKHKKTTHKKKHKAKAKHRRRGGR